MALAESSPCHSTTAAACDVVVLERLGVAGMGPCLVGWLLTVVVTVYSSLRMVVPQLVQTLDSLDSKAPQPDLQVL